jgi:hypothetical protein
VYHKANDKVILLPRRHWLKGMNFRPLDDHQDAVGESTAKYGFHDQQDKHTYVESVNIVWSLQYVLLLA